MTGIPSEKAHHDRSRDDFESLAGFRDRFIIPPGTDGNDGIYFASNSLGLQPRTTRRAVQDVLDDWAELGVAGWLKASTPWVEVEKELARLSAPLVGANVGEVCVAGTLTGNLHTLLTSFYRPVVGRYQVIMEERPFPSDRYAVCAHAARLGFDPSTTVMESKPRHTDLAATDDDVLDLIERNGQTTALVLIGAVNYYTGRSYDLDHITVAARKQGCIVGFDLAHAVGNVPVRLHDIGADFAAWCGYKYLCGGPGAPAGYFVHERHARRPDLPRLAGWWGHTQRTRFQMPDHFEPEVGAAGWQVSTPSVLAQAPLGASLRLITEAGIDRMRARSVVLTGLLESLIRSRLADQVEIITPPSPDARGAQLSLRIRSHAREVFTELTQANVFCDWREPDAIRVAPSALYNTTAEVERFVDLLTTATASTASRQSS